MPKSKKTKTKKVEQAIAVSYSGDVEVKLLRGKTVYKTIKSKNEGTAELFKFLAFALINNYKESLQPRYLVVCNKVTNSTTTTVTPLAAPIAASTIKVLSVSDNSNITVGYEFLLPYYTLVEHDKNINCLRLYSFSNKDKYSTASDTTYSAQTDITGITIADNKTNIIITWKLTIANATSNN